MKLFSITVKDIAKGFFVAVGGAVLTGVQTSLSSGNIPNAADAQTMGMAGAAAGVAYLIKQLLTNSKGELMKSEPVVAPVAEQPISSTK